MLRATWLVIGVLVFGSLAVVGFVARRRKKARVAAAELARVRAEFAPQEARAALTQWILLRQEAFTVAAAVKATEEDGRPMTGDEVASVCASLSVAVPSLRGVLPFETLRPLPPGHDSKPKFTVVRNGARVTGHRPPETMRMTRAEYIEWSRKQAGQAVYDAARKALDELPSPEPDLGGDCEGGNGGAA